MVGAGWATQSPFKETAISLNHLTDLSNHALIFDQSDFESQEPQHSPLTPLGLKMAWLSREGTSQVLGAAKIKNC